MDQPERIAVKGTVTQEPKVGQTDKGKLYTRISIAADEVVIDGRKVKADANKWHTAVFWGVDAVDRANDVKQGAQISIEGDRKVRQAEGRDGKMREFSEIHHGSLQIERQPREKVSGVPVELKGEVLYDPELKAAAGRQGQYYTVLTIRPEQNNEEKVRAAFFGKDAMEVARSVRKGADVSLKGELVEREYTNNKGEQVRGVELLGAKMLPEKQLATSRPQQPQAPRQPPHDAELGR
jgi:single-stranded DNA-binding protein